jgi:hypothetical protein
MKLSISQMMFSLGEAEKKYLEYKELFSKCLVLGNRSGIDLDQLLQNVNYAYYEYSELAKELVMSLSKSDDAFV